MYYQTVYDEWLQEDVLEIVESRYKVTWFDESENEFKTINTDSYANAMETFWMVKEYDNEAYIADNKYGVYFNGTDWF